MKAELKVVYTDNGDVNCWDIYIEGQWCGSRSTIKQCRQYINHLMNKLDEPIVISHVLYNP